MKFNKIDIENWNRKDIYKQFLENIPCTYSMTVNLNITKVLANIKKAKLKLFPVVLYGISEIVNKHLEFRMDFNENEELGYYEISNPCYTVMDKETELFRNEISKYEKSFELFYEKYIKDEKCKELSNTFNVSCIPWTSFTGFNLNLQNGYRYLKPMFTIGKYFQQNNENLLPMAIQVNHLVCDGFHVARFVNELQVWLDEFYEV